MSRLITLAVFDNAFEVKFIMLKSLLEEAGVNFLTTNEFNRTVKPALSMTPTNVAIEIRVYEEDLENAVEILRSIH